MCWRCVTFLSCQRYGRQLADAAARGDLEALHGLLQALWQDWHQPDSLRSQFLLVPMFCGDGNQKVMTYNSMTMTILLSVWLRDINSDLWYMFIKGQWTQDFFSPNVNDTHISIISSNSHMHFASKKTSSSNASMMWPAYLMSQAGDSQAGRLLLEQKPTLCCYCCVGHVVETRSCYHFWPCYYSFNIPKLTYRMCKEKNVHYCKFRSCLITWILLYPSEGFHESRGVSLASRPEFAEAQAGCAVDLQHKSRLKQGFWSSWFWKKVLVV